MYSGISCYCVQYAIKHSTNKHIYQHKKYCRFYNYFDNLNINSWVKYAALNHIQQQHNNTHLMALSLGLPG